MYTDGTLVCYTKRLLTYDVGMLLKTHPKNIILKSILIILTITLIIIHFTKIKNMIL